MLVLAKKSQKQGMLLAPWVANLSLVLLRLLLPPAPALDVLTALVSGDKQANHNQYGDQSCPVSSKHG
jgi:hypothetical protein